MDMDIDIDMYMYIYRINPFPIASTPGWADLLRRFIYTDRYRCVCVCVYSVFSCILVRQAGLICYAADANGGNTPPLNPKVFIFSPTAV